MTLVSPLIYAAVIAIHVSRLDDVNVLIGLVVGVHSGNATAFPRALRRSLGIPALCWFFSDLTSTRSAGTSVCRIANTFSGKISPE